MSNYVPGFGSGSAKLVVCGEAPGAQEEAEGRPFVGPTGQETRSMLRTAGIAPEECYFTNIFKFRPPRNDIKLAHLTGHTIEEGLDDLWTELKTIGPNSILALGNLALYTLTGKGSRKVKKGLTEYSGITNWRGSILNATNFYTKVIPSVHPAALFERRGETGPFPYSAKVYLQGDFNRAVEEAQSKEFNLPTRNINIARNSLDLYNFLERNKGKSLAALDIESMKGVPACLGIAFSRHEAISVPLLNLQALDNLYGIPLSDMAEIWRLLDKFLRNEKMKFIGHNIKYDQTKLELIGFRFKVYADTMLLQRVVNPEFPASLQFITSVYTREPYYKDEGKEFNPKKDHLDRLLNYNGRDCCVTIECFEELLKEAQEYQLEDFFFNFMMPLYPIYRDIDELGFNVDIEERNKLYVKYCRLQYEEEEKLFSLIGHPINCSSPDQIKFLLWEELKLPRRMNVDEDTLVALIANVVKKAEQKEVLSCIINIRRLRNARSKIASPLDYDGRMKTATRLGGTETGRTSTSTLDTVLRPLPMGMSFHSVTKHGELGGDIRKMFIPSIIHSINEEDQLVFFNIDLSQAEARVVALLAEDEETLDWFAKGIDIHARTASWCFDGSEELFQKGKGKNGDDPPERHVGKTTRHAAGYGMGKRRLAQIVNTDARRFHIDINISEWRAGKILEIFHGRSPKIQGVFHEQIRRVAYNNRILKTPYGRVRQFNDRLNEELFKEMYAYIPQSVVSDHLKWGMLETKRKFPWLRIIVEAHDAFCAELPRKYVNEVAQFAKEKLETPIDFSNCTLSRGQLIIPADIEVGSNYKDLKKYKLAA